MKQDFSEWSKGQGKGPKPNLIRFPVATWAWPWSISDFAGRDYYRQVQRWVKVSSSWQEYQLILITKVLQGRPIRHFTHQTVLTERCFDEIITNESEVNCP